MVGYDINFNAPMGDNITRHPLYQKYANSTLTDINIGTVKSDLQTVVMDIPSAPIVAYLSWLIRVKGLVA